MNLAKHITIELGGQCASSDQVIQRHGEFWEVVEVVENIMCVQADDCFQMLMKITDDNMFVIKGVWEQ